MGWIIPTQRPIRHDIDTLNADEPLGNEGADRPTTN
tara:strand:+ start:4656 stop:4763 length:108 start_codon:yes stop_codon:yes gene_type:complete